MRNNSTADPRHNDYVFELAEAVLEYTRRQRDSDGEEVLPVTMDMPGGPWVLSGSSVEPRWVVSRLQHDHEVKAFRFTDGSLDAPAAVMRKFDDSFEERVALTPRAEELLHA